MREWLSQASGSIGKRKQQPEKRERKEWNEMEGELDGERVSFYHQINYFYQQVNLLNGESLSTSIIWKCSSFISS